MFHLVSSSFVYSHISFFAHQCINMYIYFFIYFTCSMLTPSSLMYYMCNKPLDITWPPPSRANTDARGFGGRKVMPPQWAAICISIVCAWACVCDCLLYPSIFRNIRMLHQQNIYMSVVLYGQIFCATTTTRYPRTLKRRRAIHVDFGRCAAKNNTHNGGVVVVDDDYDTTTSSLWFSIIYMQFFRATRILLCWEHAFACARTRTHILSVRLLAAAV